MGAEIVPMRGDHDGWVARDPEESFVVLVQSEPRPVDAGKEDIRVQALELPLDEVHRAHRENVVASKARQEAQGPALDELVDPQRGFKAALVIPAS